MACDGGAEVGDVCGRESVEDVNVLALDCCSELGSMACMLLSSLVHSWYSAMAARTCTQRQRAMKEDEL